MTFFHELQNASEFGRKTLYEAPIFSAIEDGRFDINSYTYFLSQAYHHVKHTAPLMMACGARLPDRLEPVRKALVEYIEEEYGHHEWILNDLKACGVDPDTVRNGQPDLPIRLMVAFLYDLINRGNPVGLFGMVQVLEGTSVAVATPMGEKVQRTLNLPDTAFSYLYSHGSLDQEHFQFFQSLMNGITEREDQRAIVDAANVVYRLYGDMLRDVPLASPADRIREVRRGLA
ncbi:iron-containing redox enzyme family protein [Marinimicrobium sp. C6131]|jgi:thiaminase|uniref:TenA family transcriptional regulator n=1 Tax=Marinimicrobium sp. C6131 TaxID=3022676 RepID=UPI00223E67D9|nr:iron-containing redox enzyme family protein [Marinimicrobium sp. C6131]UZJ43415.1 iron-containing redox enzyme family protein [Marinimicrobium sp. C6131]